MTWREDVNSPKSDVQATKTLHCNNFLANSPRNKSLDDVDFNKPMKFNLIDNEDASDTSENLNLKTVEVVEDFVYRF